MSTLKFAETHNLVAFLEKPEESNGFEEIIDFLNISSVQYALTVNPTTYTTYIEQFWTSAKVKTVNEERQIQVLVEKRRERRPGAQLDLSAFPRFVLTCKEMRVLFLNLILTFPMSRHSEVVKRSEIVKRSEVVKRREVMK
ncbi:hypothetical protein Tco_0287583 [Tanacetum coccineum]